MSDIDDCRRKGQTSELTLIADDEPDGWLRFANIVRDGAELQRVVSAAAV
jgi:hypothetical protein